MESKQQKLRKILKEAPLPGPDIPHNVSQEVYRRKLAADIARTKTFISQANFAIESLQSKYGPCPSIYNDSQFDNLGGSEELGKDWTPETLSQAHLLAHHEVYKQMPYQPMKTDSIGIATALTLTSEAVLQQKRASDSLQESNERRNGEIAELETILADYKLANTLIKERIENHPQRMAEMQSKIDKCTSYEAQVEDKLKQVLEFSEKAKAREERLHLHLQRAVMKIYAMMDWENSQFMDEDTFKKIISGSVTLIKNLISKLDEDQKEKWVHVVPGTAEGRLMEIMVRHNLLSIRENNGFEVKLRNYGRS